MENAKCSQHARAYGGGGEEEGIGAVGGGGTAQDVHSKWTAPICILSDDVVWVKYGVEEQGQRLRQRGCIEEERQGQAEQAQAFTLW